MSTNPGSRFAWLVQCTLGGGGEGRGGRGGGGEEGREREERREGGGEGRGEGRGEKVRSTASSAMRIGGKELCVTFEGYYGGFL